VAIEVALARFKNRNLEADEPVQLLRFANRVPLQFDKSGCAITWAIESVNWKAYGLSQPKNSLPLGQYVFAVSVVSPFIKFKNASKETIDASEELVEELRRALIQAGQKLSRHIKKEVKEADLERKLAHIEQFGPILVESLVRITKSSNERKKRAEDGLRKLLGRDSDVAVDELAKAESRLAAQSAKDRKTRGDEDEANPHAEKAEESGEQMELAMEGAKAAVAKATKAAKGAKRAPAASRKKG
jgi:DNA topoisomerase-6 subunit B